MANTNFRNKLEKESMPWMLRTYGIRFFGTAIGLVTDLMLEACSLALKAAWLKHEDSPADALPSFGSERELPRAPGETDAAYRTRLADAWEFWDGAGTTSFADNALAPLGVAETSNSIIADRDWDVQGIDWWSRFWILLEPPLPWSRWNVGDAGVFVGATDRTIGSTATLVEVRSACQLIQKYKSGHELGVFILLDFDATIIGVGDIGDAGKLIQDTHARWPLGRFIGTQHWPYAIGGPHPYGPTEPDVIGGKIVC